MFSMILDGLVERGRAAIRVGGTPAPRPRVTDFARAPAWARTPIHPELVNPLSVSQMDLD